MIALKLSDIVPLHTIPLRGFRPEQTHPAVLIGAPESATFFRYSDSLSLIISLEEHGKDGLWLHTSASGERGKKLPSWEQLREIKSLVHGDRVTIQVLPPRAQYLNLAEVLHLWERLDAPTIPESIWRLQ